MYFSQQYKLLPCADGLSAWTEEILFSLACIVSIPMHKSVLFFHQSCSILLLSSFNASSSDIRSLLHILSELDIFVSRLTRLSHK